MAKVRSRFSKKSKYWLPKHVFMTAYHYCLNYREWKAEHDLSVGLRSTHGEGGSGGTGDPTASQAMRLADLAEKIMLIEDTVNIVAPEINAYLLAYVTDEDLTFDMIKAQGCPCERAMFYDRRRAFYFLLATRLKL